MSEPQRVADELQRAFTGDGDQRGPSPGLKEIAQRMYTHKFLRFCRLKFGIPDRELKKIMAEHITENNFYNILKGIYDSERRRFVQIMRENGIGAYAQLDISLNSRIPHLSEIRLNEDIYELISKIREKDRYKFIYKKLGAQNLPQREVARDVTPELILHILQWWWDWKGHGMSDGIGGINFLESTAEGEYMQPKQNDVAIGGRFFENPNQH